MGSISENIHLAAQYVSEAIGREKPGIGIILGSGLGILADNITDRITIPYKEVPGFPVSTAIGHKGNFIYGTLGGKKVLAMQGRFHYYEGYSMELVTMSIRVMKLLGIECVFVSNAAGACNPDFKVGDLVVIRDHINTLPNPLVGPNLDEFGPRFPDMTCAYDIELQKLAFNVAAKMGVSLKSGVYFGSTGPTYETPAEVRFYRAIGADLVGMSTIPEVIVARHCGIRVFGMSVATNVSNVLNEETNLNDGKDVVNQAEKAAITMSELFRRMISEL